MLYVIAIVLGALVLLMIWQFNSLISIRQLTRNAWSDIDVYLKRRAELIPNLVAAVKAYATHEQTTLVQLSEARSRAAAIVGPTPDKSSAESAVGSNLTRVIMLAEAYPELKANSEFLSLQNDLRETEKLIANARQFYNACVRDLNTKIEAFPSNILAAMIGVKHMDFFELSDISEANVPSLS